MTTDAPRDKLPLAQLPTPLEPLDRLSESLGTRVLVKRDDQTGLALGGNKARKLEFLCAEAVAQGADVLVTGGGHQSNHVRMSVAAANHLGLRSHLVLGGHEPEVFSGNLLLDRVLGASIEFCGADDYYGVERAIATASERLAAEGRHPYPIPIGGASVTGALAYVEAADEILGQAASLGIDLDRIVVADGSGGTQAGLVAGLGSGSDIEVVGVDVGTRPDVDTTVPELAATVADAAGRGRVPERVTVDHDHAGPGYGRLTPECLEALRLAARLEGLLLDPVYTGKAMAALISRVRDGRIGRDETVVFWHTGGTPALFARPYERDLTTGGA